MARTEKPFRLRKRGAVWYYKTPTMQNFRTTEETSRAKAERKVVKLLSIGMAGKRNPSFKEYAEPFFDYERCPHVARLKAEKKRIGEGYCKKERKALVLYVFPSKMARKPIADDHTWAIPGGGYSDKDKILLNTAIRETYEETGIFIQEACHVKTYRLPFFTYAVFSSELDREKLPKRNWESEEIRCFPISDLPNGMNIMTGIEIKDFMKKDER